MQLSVEQVVQLVDQQGRQIGQIEIERTEENLIFGRFITGPAFSSVQPLFQEFEEAVDAQALSVVDELDAAISALGLHVHTLDNSLRIEAHDVQIWSDQSITFRVSSATVSAENGDLGNRPSVRSENARDNITSRST